MAAQQNVVLVARWTGGQHPTLSGIVRQMRHEGLRPYEWKTLPNQRYAVRSHGYAKVVYVVEGSVEITLPDTGDRVILRAGDRIELPAGIRHGTIIGSSGALCVESALQRR